MGYHTKEIKKGTLGQASKIREEFEEFEDALEQENKVLVLCELSDLVGAIKHYLRQYHVGITLKDLEKMADKTEEAFNEGTRK